MVLIYISRFTRDPSPHSHKSTSPVQKQQSWFPKPSLPGLMFLFHVALSQPMMWFADPFPYLLVSPGGALTGWCLTYFQPCAYSFHDHVSYDYLLKPLGIFWNKCLKVNPIDTSGLERSLGVQPVGGRFQHESNRRTILGTRLHSLSTTSLTFQGQHNSSSICWTPPSILLMFLFDTDHFSSLCYHKSFSCVWMNE